MRLPAPWVGVFARAVGPGWRRTRSAAYHGPRIPCEQLAKADVPLPPASMPDGHAAYALLFHAILRGGVVVLRGGSPGSNHLARWAFAQFFWPGTSTVAPLGCRNRPGCHQGPWERTRPAQRHWRLVGLLGPRRR